MVMPWAAAAASGDGSSSSSSTRDLGRVHSVEELLVNEGEMTRLGKTCSKLLQDNAAAAAAAAAVDDADESSSSRT